jgi:hypothetical protein
MNKEQQKPDVDLAAMGEKALDITLGLASLGVEAVGLATQYVTDKAPEWVANLEERGKPLRERFLGGSRSSPASETEVSGEEEINALEDRIRELEQQVGQEVVVEATEETQTVSSAPASPASLTFVAPDVADDDELDSGGRAG